MDHASHSHQQEECNTMRKTHTSIHARQSAPDVYQAQESTACPMLAQGLPLVYGVSEGKVGA
jgi:hypothetical protein